MRFEDLHLVARIFIESNLADAEHARTIEKLWDERDDFAREDGIFRFLRIDAEPGVMSNAVLRGALGLEVGELPEVVLKSFGRRSIVARPKCWLRNRNTSGERHALVVVGGATHHVNMWIDIHQRAPPEDGGTAPVAPLVPARAIGSVE